MEKYTDFYFGEYGGSSFSLGHYCEAYIDWGRYGMLIQLFLFGVLGGGLFLIAMARTSALNPLLSLGILWVCMKPWGTFQQDMITMSGQVFWGAFANSSSFFLSIGGSMPGSSAKDFVQKQKKVTWVHRRPRALGNFSMEATFKRLHDAWPAPKPLEHTVCDYSKGIMPRWRIWKQVNRLESDILHITGDINFACIAQKRDSGTQSGADHSRRGHARRRTLG